jgi:hypothetical protein
MLSRSRLPLLIGALACAASGAAAQQPGATPFAQGDAEYAFGGRLTFADYSIRTLGGRYGHFVTPRAQVGGSVSMRQVSGGGSSATAHVIGAFAAYHLTTVPIGEWVPAVGAALNRVSPYGDSDPYSSYGISLGAKRPLRDDIRIRASLDVGRTTLQGINDTFAAITVSPVPVTNAGLFAGAAAATGLLREGRISGDGGLTIGIEPYRNVGLRALGGYHVTDALEVGGDRDLHWSHTLGGGGNTSYVVGMTGNFFPPLGAEPLHPYAGVSTGAHGSGLPGANTSSWVGWQAGARYFVSPNVAPFAELGLQRRLRGGSVSDPALRFGLALYAR